MTLSKRVQSCDPDLPGADLVNKGLADLGAGLSTEEAYLVLIAGPRLRGLGIAVPKAPPAALSFEHRLYELLEITHGPGAYSRYNALFRRMVSFAHALENRKAKSIQT